MKPSPYDDCWPGLTCLAAELAINHPMTESVAPLETRVIKLESDHDVDHRSAERVRNFLAADRKR